MKDLYRRHRRLQRRGPVVLRLRSDDGDPFRAQHDVATRGWHLTDGSGREWNRRFRQNKRRKVLGALATGRPCYVELFRLNHQGGPFVEAGWPTRLGPTAWYRDCADRVAVVLEYVTVRDGYALRPNKPTEGM